jgi:transcription antitermination factor NusG
VPAKENIKTEIGWHVAAVNTRLEIETADRINSAGFVAYCPTWEKKSGHHRGTRHFFKTKREPLFPSYLFVQRDAAFSVDQFQTEKSWLTVFWGCRLISEDEMKKIRALATSLTEAQSRTIHMLPIKRGDMLQVIHGLMTGDRVKVLRTAQAQIEVAFLDKPGYRPAWINRSSLAKAI